MKEFGNARASFSPILTASLSADGGVLIPWQDKLKIHQHTPPVWVTANKYLY